MIIKENKPDEDEAMMLIVENQEDKILYKGLIPFMFTHTLRMKIRREYRDVGTLTVSVFQEGSLYYQEFNINTNSNLKRA